MKKLIVALICHSPTWHSYKLQFDLKGKTILQRLFEKCLKINEANVFFPTYILKVKKSCLNYTHNFKSKVYF